MINNRFLTDMLRYFFVALIILSCARGKAINSNFIGQDKIPSANELIDSIKRKIPLWIEVWESHVELIPKKFIVKSDTLNYIDNYQYKLNEILDKHGFLRYSIDHTKFVDIYSYNIFLSEQDGKIFGQIDVDSKVILVQRDTNTSKVLHQIGSLGGYDDSFWFSGHSFVVLGYQQEWDKKLQKNITRPIILYFDLKNLRKIQLTGPSCDVIPDYFSKKYPFVLF